MDDAQQVRANRIFKVDQYIERIEQLKLVFIYGPCS